MKFKNNINGIIIIDKSKGITSRDVVDKVQKKLNTKAGHTGTLDPIATGVLVITLGKATKLNEILTSTNKTYEAEAILGIETDSLDITGNIINQKDTIFSKEKIIDCLNHFKGSYYQEVPKYSAVKIKGKKLYEYAREDIDIKLPKRLVHIHDINLLDYQVDDDKTKIKFNVSVSKGTYIRSLIRDIGAYLNTYATMSNLRRTKQGDFGVEKAHTLEEISKQDVIPITEALNIQKIKVKDQEKFKIINGQKLNYDYNEVLFLDQNNNPLAIYKKKGNALCVWKMLYDNENK